MTGSALAVVTAVVAIGAAGFVVALEHLLVEAVAERVEAEAERLGDDLEDGVLAPSSLAGLDDDHFLAAFVAGDTVTVNDDDAFDLPRPAPDDTVRTIVDGEPYLVRSERLDEGQVLVVAGSVEEAEQATAAVVGLLAVAVPAALAVVGGVVWWVVGRALVPVERIRRQVDAVDAAGLSSRVPATGSGDEIDRLAGTMNRMLARLESAQAAQRRFVGDASHELRSPLASIRQHAELAREHPEAAPAQALADIVLVESSRLQDLVEGLLLLARLDERGGVAEPAAVDLDDIALRQGRRLRSLGAVAVDTAGIAAARVRGDVRLLESAARNLVDNAARHARGTVALTTEEHDGRAMLHVDDDGHGVPPQDRERVFGRFVRLDEARSRDAGGSGLGLAIAYEVARAHGGTAQLTSSPLGGARVTLSLPAEAADPP